MSENAQLPAREVRRAQIEQKRDQFRQMAYDAELEIETATVQIHGVTAQERNRSRRLLEDKARNCRASAARLDELLVEVDAEIAAEKEKDAAADEKAESVENAEEAKDASVKDVPEEKSDGG